LESYECQQYEKSEQTFHRTKIDNSNGIIKYNKKPPKKEAFLLQNYAHPLKSHQPETLGLSL